MNFKEKAFATAKHALNVARRLDANSNNNNNNDNNNNSNNTKQHREQFGLLETKLQATFDFVFKDDNDKIQ